MIDTLKFEELSHETKLSVGNSLYQAQVLLRTAGKLLLEKGIITEDKCSEMDAYLEAQGLDDLLYGGDEELQ